jgi:hypothetical protein
MNYSKVDSAIKSCTPLDISGSVDDIRIEAASKKIGVSFPADYVLFLRRYGTIQMGSEEVFGLGGEPHLDIAFQCENASKDQLSWPPNSIPLRTDGFGNYDLLIVQTDIPEDSQYTIFEWHHDDGNTRFLAATLDSWLCDLAELAKD